jgi:uncharacterized membrane protein
MSRWLPILIIILALVGFVDAGYLTWGYYSGSQIKCSILEGCNTVLNSEYSTFWNSIPNSLLGMIYYGSIIFLLTVYLSEGLRMALQIATLVVAMGIGFSAYFVYLQLFVIQAICIYCMVSATATALLGILVPMLLRYNKLSDGK